MSNNSVTARRTWFAQDDAEQMCGRNEMLSLHTGFRGYEGAQNASGSNKGEGQKLRSFLTIIVPVTWPWWIYFTVPTSRRLLEIKGGGSS